MKYCVLAAIILATACSSNKNADNDKDPNFQNSKLRGPSKAAQNSERIDYLKNKKEPLTESEKGELKWRSNPEALRLSQTIDDKINQNKVTPRELAQNRYLKKGMSIEESDLNAKEELKTITDSEKTRLIELRSPPREPGNLPLDPDARKAHNGG
jgi:hypothetical protein